jgi:hypothetical protein
MSVANVVPLIKERNILRCRECGATTSAPCDCGAILEIMRPGKAAAIALKENPKLSDRAIAQRLNISSNTVRSARAQLSTAQNCAVETRTGLDGKARKMPEPPRILDPVKHRPVCLSHEEGEENRQVLRMIKRMKAHQRRNLFDELIEKYGMMRWHERT